VSLSVARRAASAERARVRAEADAADLAADIRAFVAAYPPLSPAALAELAALLRGDAA
jgi:hypothetical protein